MTDFSPGISIPQFKPDLGGPIPPAMLDNYIIGIDASSYVDPGGGNHRRPETETAVTNLASATYTVSPHFDPGNLPILHTGDWTWDDESVVPAPGSQDWFSINRSAVDSSFPNLTEWELDVDVAPPTSDEYTVVLGFYADSSDLTYWTSAFYSTTAQSRVAFNTGTGRFDAVTPDATVTNLAVAANWDEDNWHQVAFSIKDAGFQCMVDGVEPSYIASPANLGGTFQLANIAWGSTQNGGWAFVHVWNTWHDWETLDPVQRWLSNYHGTPYVSPY